MTKKDIKAKVIYKWNHKNSKFQVGDTVRVWVPVPTSNVAKSTIANHGRVGTVFAASSPNGRTMRDGDRVWTKYYVSFPDTDEVIGVNSWFLIPAKEH